MALTSDDVVNFPLKHGMRGYVISQVDELLDEVADELDRLHAEIEQLTAARDQALADVEQARQEVERRADAEGELRRVLLRAETAAEEAMAEAQQEADDVVKGARLQAEQILEEAREQARRERDQVLADLDAQEARFRVRRRELMTRVERLQEFEAESRRLLRGLLEDQLARLEDPEIVSGLEDIAGPTMEHHDDDAARADDAGTASHAPASHDPTEDRTAPADGGVGDDHRVTDDGAVPLAAGSDASAMAEPAAVAVTEDLLDDLDDVMLLGDDPASGDAGDDPDDHPEGPGESAQPAAASGRRRRDRSFNDGV